MATGSTEEGSPLGFPGPPPPPDSRRPGPLVLRSSGDISCDERGGGGDYKQVGIRRGQYRLFLLGETKQGRPCGPKRWTMTRPRKPEFWGVLFGRGTGYMHVHFVRGRLRPCFICLFIGLFIYYPLFRVLGFVFG